MDGGPEGPEARQGQLEIEDALLRLVWVPACHLWVGCPDLARSSARCCIVWHLYQSHLAAAVYR